jgi:2-polyprenyl-6-methoxyphenol hydroxylase-like FAD-dependent oxidoreductase
MHPDNAVYDAIVVGGRAAGASTALLLARHGRRVLVVDRSRYGADTLSTHALMRAGVLQLQRFGVLDRIVAAGTPPIRRTTFSYAHDRVEIDLKPSHGIDALYAPRRTVLDPILVDAAEAAGARFRFSVTVTGLMRDDRGRVTGVIIRDREGRSGAVAATIVIGADGVRSTVAQLLDAPIERAGTGAPAVVYGYWSGLDAEGYEWAYRDHLAAGVIPTNLGQACVFAAAPPGRIGSGGLEVLREVLAEAAPDVAARIHRARSPVGLRSFTGRPGFVRRAWGPGWALVGDAGYWKDPLSAHGITDALRDAELLARALLSCDPGGREQDDAVAAYQATRDALSMRLFDVVDQIAAQRWGDVEIRDLLLQLNAAMADEVEALVALDAVVVR